MNALSILAGDSDDEEDQVSIAANTRDNVLRRFQSAFPEARNVSKKSKYSNYDPFVDMVLE